MISENFVYQVKGADLMQFAEYLIASTREQLQAENTETYLAPDEVCKMLSVDLSTLWRWNKRGYLCHTKVGSKNRYKRSDVIRIAEGGV